MEMATKAEVEGLKQTVHDAMEEVKKGQKENRDTIAQLIKDAIANHPGLINAQPRTVQFPEGDGGFTKEARTSKIIQKMPKEMQAEVDKMLILSKMLKTSPKNLKSWTDFSAGLGDFKKALDTAAAGGGDEWVPTDFTTTFYEFVRLESKVANLFPVIQMPRSPYLLPIQIGRISSFKQAEQTADTGQTKITVGDDTSITDATTLTAVQHASRVLTSKELEEDSIVPILPFIRSEMLRVLVEGREDCIVNGDTGTHEDSDITGSTDRRTMWKGLRALGNENSYRTDLSTFNLTNLRSMRKNMGKYGVYPKNLAWVVGISGMIKMLSLPEVVTVDKYGPAATVLSGEIAKVDGIPVIVSQWVREALNSAAVYESGQTKTALSLVYTPGFVIGEVRPVKVQLLSELYAESGQDALIVTERAIWNSLFPIASNRVTELGYNFV